MRLHRSPLPFWVLAVATALFTGVTVNRLVGEAAARAARLGGLVDVVVAARSVDVGSPLRAADVTVRRLPADALPDGPVLSTTASAAGKVALVPLVRGEAVLVSKLAPDGLRGVAALVPSGHRALAVPVDPGGLSFRLGNRVDVLATFDVAGDPAAGPGPGAAVSPEPTFPVATAAVVVDVGDQAVTVAVTSDEAPRVAFALARGTVTLALTAP